MIAGITLLPLLLGLFLFKVIPEGYFNSTPPQPTATDTSFSIEQDDTSNSLQLTLTPTLQHVTPTTTKTPFATWVRPPASEQQYTVQAGDTLGEIAQQFEVTAEEIAARNNLSNVDDVLYAGQVLIIPVAGSMATVPAGSATTTAGGERIHIVQPGENFYRIALLYGLTWQEIAAYNNIADPDSIEVGQAISIPPSQ